MTFYPGMVVHVCTLLNTQKAEAGESVEYENIRLAKATKEKGKKGEDREREGEENP